MKLTLFFALSMLAFIGNAQDGFEIILLDRLSRTDTVVFGMDNSATTGIDTDFGETNIYATSYDSLEIRSVMRNTDSHLCLTSSTFENNGDPLAFSENIDLKRDFREFVLFSPLNNNYEFTINAIAYPLTIITDFTKWHPIGTWGVWIGLLGSNCEPFLSQYANENAIDTLIIDEDNSVKSIIVKLDHEVGINAISESSILRLYPNPMNSVSILEIDKVDTQNDMLAIYSINGQLVFSQSINGKKKIEINKSNFKTGLYYLRYMGHDGFVEVSKMVIE